ncbi:hypothetical protein Fmac_017404 [Flemingia macrophylla]|uniref:Protein kinase domain-containing protein n=1 Tax=Flemingia macrophylla TaxID=520843 RepID=A0ABD1M2Q5_9FABA
MFLKCLVFCRWKHSLRQHPTQIEELCHRFSFADLRKSTNNFDHSKLIERKASAKVYKGCLLHNDGSVSIVAVKRFNGERSLEWDLFKNEVELLCQLRHPNFISLIGFCNHQNEKILVYEYMSNGSLHKKLRGGDNRETLSWKKRLKICIGTARGLHYLHAGAKRTIIHRDINTRNILLDENMEPKLSGFGLCLQGARYNSKPKPIEVDCMMGSVDYMAMDYVVNGIVTDKCDVYSFGWVLLEVVCGCGRIYVTKLKSVEESIDLNIKGNIAPQCWQVFIDIIIRCLENEPHVKPTMGEVEVELEHALSLQEQADATNNTNGDYTLFSSTMIDPWWNRNPT